MSWYPIAFLPPQYVNLSGVPYTGAVLKAYAEGTTTPIAMATSYAGTTTMRSAPLNASGYPTYGGNVFIPHVQADYKLALYPTQAAADADSGALWSVDNIKIADTTNTSFYQTFDGDGVTKTFTLSQDLGTDEQTLMVFADRALPDFVTNGGFATDTGWTKGVGWTIAGGVAVATGAISTALSQNASIPLIAGESYTATFTITREAGVVAVNIGGTPGADRTASGTYSETIIAGATQALTFLTNAFTGTIDAVTVKPTYGARRQVLRADEFTLVNSQLTLAEAPPLGTKNVIVFAPSLLLGAASASAAAAATSEANSATYATNALAAANAAAASAIAAAAVFGTSTTSIAIGTGAKTFVTQTGKGFVPGMPVTITGQVSAGNMMYGVVTSYDTGTGALVMNITQTSGSGTIAAWNIAYGTASPQMTVCTVGSAVYRTPTNAKVLWVRMVGGGGGGGGGGGANGDAKSGSDGGDTTFGAVFGATGGKGGTSFTSAGGVGSIAPLGYGLPLEGNSGGGFRAIDTQYGTGGTGGAGVWGGNGAGVANGAGTAAKANSGAGGGGGGHTNAAGLHYAMSGGGAGGYVDGIIHNPASTYDFVVGAGGAGGAAGTDGYAGGAGGSGFIFVMAFF